MDAQGSHWNSVAVVTEGKEWKEKERRKPCPLSSFLSSVPVCLDNGPVSVLVAVLVLVLVPLSMSVSSRW